MPPQEPASIGRSKAGAARPDVAAVEGLDVTVEAALALRPQGRAAKVDPGEDGVAAVRVGALHALEAVPGGSAGRLAEGRDDLQRIRGLRSHRHGSAEGQDRKQQAGQESHRNPHRNRAVMNKEKRPTFKGRLR